MSFEPPSGCNPALGVVIVTFNAVDVIADCLESLLGATGVRLAIVVVDNASPDGTANHIREWATGLSAASAFLAPGPLPITLDRVPKPVPLHTGAPALDPSGHRVTLIEAGVNCGFAGGVNRGLAYLTAIPQLDRFWILNPDCIVPDGTAATFARYPGPGPGGAFALMGGRVIYLDGECDTIQIDGGLIDRRTGVTHNINMFARHSCTPPPDPARFDFVMGASMVASRAFLDAAGPMNEAFFLYYEEADWALRRDALPLAYAPAAIVYHRVGTAIGTGRPGRPASPFALYFLHRNRLRFVRRHLPRSLPGAYTYSLAKAGQLAAKGYVAEARAVLAGTFGRPPPAAIRTRLSPDAARIAFGG